MVVENVEDVNNELNFAARVEFADNIPQISGGGLSGTYQFLQYHVHWGTSDSAGSEHQIDGQQWVRIFFFFWGTLFLRKTLFEKLQYLKQEQ